MDPVIQESEPLLGTSTLRGILLLGGVVAVAYVAYQFWKKAKTAEKFLPPKPKVIRVPVELPIPPPRK